MPVGRTKPTITIGAWVKIPLELLADVDAEKQTLTVRNEALWKARGAGLEGHGPEYYELFKEEPGFLLVPRNHQAQLRRDLVRSAYAVKLDVPLAYPRVDLGEDKVVLGPNQWQPIDQKPAFAALTAPPTFPYGRIAALRCGFGKSLIALKGAHLRGGRTLWVTMNTSLLEQAKRDIQRWLGLPLEKIGHVQANVQEWKGYNIAVSMLHTLVSRDYGEEFWNYWNLVIFDEGDVLGTENFMKVAPRFPCERWLLTATPQRDDKMETLFEKHMGPVCYTYLEYDTKPQIHFLHTGADSKNLCHAGWDSFNNRRRVNFPLTAAKLLRNDARTSLLLENIGKAAASGRTCLVLADSVEGLAELYKRAKDELPYTCGLVVGRIKQKERADIIQNNQVVFATTSLAYRGLDRPAFDTLFVATLSAVKESLWVQGVGRILRALKDKKQPLVVVLIDEIEPIQLLGAKLADLFKRKGWPVRGAEKLYELRKNRAKRQTQMRQESAYGY